MAAPSDASSASSSSRTLDLIRSIRRRAQALDRSSDGTDGKGDDDDGLEHVLDGLAIDDGGNTRNIPESRADPTNDELIALGREYLAARRELEVMKRSQRARPAAAEQSLVGATRPAESGESSFTASSASSSTLVTSSSSSNLAGQRDPQPSSHTSKANGGNPSSRSISPAVPGKYCHACGHPVVDASVENGSPASNNTPPPPLAIRANRLPASSSSSAARPGSGLSSRSTESSPSTSSSCASSNMTAEKELELLKAQVQDIMRVCKAVATGDLTQKIIVPVEGPTMVELKDIINGMVDQLSVFATEVERVSLEVGTRGILGGQIVVPGSEGSWALLVKVVNRLAGNLTSQVRSINSVMNAVAKGDLSKTIEVEADGEVAELKVTINRMVMQLRSLADEVSKVSYDVGSLGLLGRVATLPNAEGVWKELTDNVNRECWTCRQRRIVADLLIPQACARR